MLFNLDFFLASCPGSSGKAVGLVALQCKGKLALQLRDDILNILQIVWGQMFLDHTRKTKLIQILKNELVEIQ